MFFRSTAFKITAVLIASTFICVPLVMGLVAPAAAEPKPSSIVQAVKPLPPPTEEEMMTALDFNFLSVSTSFGSAVSSNAVKTVEDAATKKAAAEKAAAEKAAADKKAAEEKAAADKKAAEEKAAADKKAAEEKAAADKGEQAEDTEDLGDDTEAADDDKGDLPETGSNGIANSLQRDGRIHVSDLRRVATEEPYDIPNAFLSEASGYGSSLSISEFKALCGQHKVNQKYVQRFIDDAFVYRMGNTYSYTPVNPSLRTHNYNWDYLTHNGSVKDYVVNGKSRATLGIDVSYAQGNIDWNRVANSGIEFAYIRLGRRTGVSGEIGLDTKFHQNMKGAKAAGLKVGVYFYTQAINNAEAREEANFVINTLRDNGYTVDMPVMFDIEGGESASYRGYSIGIQTATNVCKTFLDTVKNAGYNVVLYSYAKYSTEKLDLSQLQGYDFWLAQYYHVPFFPYKMKYWQYSASGSVPGIKGGVDMNLMFHD